MINLSRYLNDYESSIDWVSLIDKYIKDQDDILLFEHTSDGVFCSLDTSRSFLNSLDGLDELLKLSIMLDLAERKISDIKGERDSALEKLKATPRKLHVEHLNIYDVDGVDDLSLKVVDEIKAGGDIYEIFNKYVYFITYFYELNTVLDNLKKIRNAIRASELSDDIKNASLQAFKMPKLIHDYLNDGVRRLKSDRMTTTNKPIEIPNIQHFIEFNKKLLNAPVAKTDIKAVFTKIVCMAALSCGRRLTELVYLSDFERVSDYKIKITGLGKKKEDNKTSVIVPTLFMTSDEIIKAVSIIRGLIPKTLKTRKAIVKHAHNLMQYRIIDKMFLVDGKTTSLRAIYAMTSEFIYNQHNPSDADKKRQDTYMQEVLGHEAEDYEALKHYFKRNIIRSYFDIKGYLVKSKTAMM